MLWQIVGADSCKSERPEEQAARLVAHIRAVRSLRGLEGARIVFCPESNLAHEGKRIAQDLARERVREVYCLMEDVKGNEGVRTTEALKKEMVISFGALLRQHRVRWHPKMACVSRSEHENYSPESMRKLIIDELAAYQREIKPNKTNPNAPPREIFSGKLSGCDDHCIAIQLCHKAVEFWHANQDFYRRLRPLYDTSPYLTGA